jgi:hypothetical protein
MWRQLFRRGTYRAWRTAAIDKAGEDYRLARSLKRPILGFLGKVDSICQKAISRRQLPVVVPAWILATGNTYSTFLFLKNVL